MKARPTGSPNNTCGSGRGLTSAFETRLRPGYLAGKNILSSPWLEVYNLQSGTAFVISGFYFPILRTDSCIIEHGKLISTVSPGSGVGVCVGVLELTELTLKSYFAFM